jgi:hypothetical protein
MHTNYTGVTNVSGDPLTWPLVFRCNGAAVVPFKVCMPFFLECSSSEQVVATRPHIEKKHRENPRQLLTIIADYFQGLLLRGQA